MDRVHKGKNSLVRLPARTMGAFSDNSSDEDAMRREAHMEREDAMSFKRFVTRLQKSQKGLKQRRLSIWQDSKQGTLKSSHLLATGLWKTGIFISDLPGSTREVYIPAIAPNWILVVIHAWGPSERGRCHQENWGACLRLKFQHSTFWVSNPTDT